MRMQGHFLLPCTWVLTNATILGFLCAIATANPVLARAQGTASGKVALDRLYAPMAPIGWR